MGTPAENRTFFGALVGDGRPALYALSLGLIVSGGTALFLAATGHFLPHDERYLGMTAEQLCGYNGCRVVHFMVHDRASFGGVVLAIGLLYLWLIEFPLRARQAWAWWALLFSGAVGFASFLAYVGFGYLDAWHGAATLALLPCYVVGLVRSWPTLGESEAPAERKQPARQEPRPPGRWHDRSKLGWACLLLTALGVTGAGLTILTVGMTAVFVPQDLAYLGVGVADLRALNPRLVPLIAHDRAGFGGALLSCGVALMLCVWYGRPSPSLWQVLLLAGLAGFVPAIGVHFAIGYTDAVHLAPAVAGAVLYVIGLALT
ncbi:MAG TPA: hypothetical protein VH120_16215, partial [Gemmataceae bacterium]|nr:hypothetical protein [Gemmataceae bacterium]